MKVELITHTPEIEKVIALAAKNCYTTSSIEQLSNGLTKEVSQKFIGMLMDLGHESPLEHCSFTFAISDVSRSLLAQITRHRIASFSVQSQRYVKMGDFKYVTPSLISKSSAAFIAFNQAMHDSTQRYQEIHQALMDQLLADEYNSILPIEGEDIEGYKAKIERFMSSEQLEGWLSKSLDDVDKTADEMRKNFKKKVAQIEKIANENARSVLPNAACTQMILTMNVRELLHFFSLRCCRRAQDEIRGVADTMLSLCREVSPLIFSLAGPGCVRGVCSEGKMSCGAPRKDLKIL